MKKYISVMAMVLGLSACVDTPDKVAPTLSVSGQAIPLAVSSVEIINPLFDVNAPSDTLEAKMAGTLQNWAGQLFHAASGKDHLFVTIEKASLVMQPLERQSSGFKSLFTKDQEARYDASVVIRLELHDEHSNVRHTGVVSAGRTMTLLEGLTLQERDEKITAFLNALLKDLDSRMHTAVQEGLPDLML